MVAGLYGLAIGSFLNVVIWRLPRGQSVNTPTWSYCPNCEHRLGTLDLFPVFSFLALGAKCRYCKRPISWRYPGVELLTGVLFALVAWYTFQAGGRWYDAVFYCLFTAILLCVFFIDLEHFIIPDSLSALAVVLGLVHGAVSGFFVSSVAGLFGYAAAIYLIGLVSYVYLVSVLDKRLPALSAAGAYLRENAEDWAYVTVYQLGAIVKPLRRYAEKRWGEEAPLEGFTAAEIEADEDAGGMGGGDGKLAAAIGANLGLALALGSLGFAIFLGAFAGVIVLVRARRRLGERIPIPFGPAMAAGALLALFYGQPLAAWYVRTAFPPAPAPSAVSVGGPHPASSLGDPLLPIRSNAAGIKERVKIIRNKKAYEKKVLAVFSLPSPLCLRHYCVSEGEGHRETRRGEVSKKTFVFSFPIWEQSCWQRRHATVTAAGSRRTPL